MVLYLKLGTVAGIGASLGFALVSCIHFFQFNVGVCVCDPGYFDDDCSVDKNIAPTMFGIPDRGKCDLSQRECKMTAVKGGTFVDTKDLYCRLKPFKVITSVFVIVVWSLFLCGSFDSVMFQAAKAATFVRNVG